MKNSDPNQYEGNALPQQLPSRRLIRSLKTKADAERTWYEKAADWTTGAFGSVGFLVLNVAWFVAWITLNTNVIPGIEPFDPFPFGLLTMIVSLEAIILSIFVLISQNRASQVDSLRDEVDLQVDIITEQELTKLMQMVYALMKKQRIDITQDKVLSAMLKPIDLNRLETTLEKQVFENRKTKKNR